MTALPPGLGRPAATATPFDASYGPRPLASQLCQLYGLVLLLFAPFLWLLAFALDWYFLVLLASALAATVVDAARLLGADPDGSSAGVMLLVYFVPTVAYTALGAWQLFLARLLWHRRSWAPGASAATWVVLAGAQLLGAARLDLGSWPVGTGLLAAAHLGAAVVAARSGWATGGPRLGGRPRQPAGRSASSWPK